MLEYHIVPNPFSDNPNSGIARPVNVTIYTEEQVIDLMTKRATGLGKPDILAMKALEKDVVTDIVENGDGVVTAVYQIHPSMSGIYNGPEDSYDPSRHSINVNTTPGTAVRAASKRIKTKKVHVADPQPDIMEVKDVVSGSINDQLTLGGILQLQGYRLRFIETSASNGIFLIPETGSAIKLTVIADNKPSRLTTQIPLDLPQGEYHLEVRSTYLSGSKKEGKTLKTGRFNRILTV